MSETPALRILGVDPGLGTCGFGLLDMSRDGLLTVVEYGVITTDKEHPIPRRLEVLERDLGEVCKTYKPAAAAVEDFLPTDRTKHNAPMVLQARGVVLLVLQRHKQAIAEYLPNVIKKDLTGNGRADKRDMQEAITEGLGLASVPRPDDAADALSIAYVHAMRLGARGLEPTTAATLRRAGLTSRPRR